MGVAYLGSLDYSVCSDFPSVLLSIRLGSGHNFTLDNISGLWPGFASCLFSHLCEEWSLIGGLRMPHRRVRGSLSCTSCLRGRVLVNGCPTPVVMKEERTVSPSRLEWTGLSGVFELFLGKSASHWPEDGGAGGPGGLLVKMAEWESR